MAPLLTLDGVRVSVDGTEVVRGLDLVIEPGEVHAIMGPNGSGKSTLVSALAGHPAYEITGGSAQFRGKNLLEMAAHERAQAGLFLAFQYPKEIAGVSLRSFLFAAYKTQAAARFPDDAILSPVRFAAVLTEAMAALHMDAAFAERSLNQGFSGGERKKAEILQMRLLRPLLGLLDETDSGLDVDALKIVAQGVQDVRNASSAEPFSALIVTHYARILEYIEPDHVHVMVQGRIVESGGPAFARDLERDGYARYMPAKRIELDA